MLVEFNSSKVCFSPFKIIGPKSFLYLKKWSSKLILSVGSFFGLVSVKILKKVLLHGSLFVNQLAKGGLGIINIKDWNKVNLCKLLWALSMKRDKLWVQWVHAYYIKRREVDDFVVPANISWSLRNILKCRTLTDCHKQEAKPIAKKIYVEVRHNVESKSWKNVIMKNPACPRAVFIAWMVLWQRLPTKDRLSKFGVHTDLKCIYCAGDETIQHMFFDCDGTRSIWKKLLSWARHDHVVQDFASEMRWIERKSKGSLPKNKLAKAVFAEYVYAIWTARNKFIFQGKPINPDEILNELVLTIHTRCSLWRSMEGICRLITYPFV